LMTGEEISKAVEKIAVQIINKNKNIKDLVFIGIVTRGVHLATRIINEIKKLKKLGLPLGMLDITFYRDDVDSIGKQPLAKETKIDFDINDKKVILVDDVLFTGRSIRAALDEIMDFGRPNSVELVVLIDRGHRELPVYAEYVGKTVKTNYSDKVHVHLKEIDKTDRVVLVSKKSSR